MLKIMILDYSILGKHLRESALFSKNVRGQLTSLGHAGFPLFPELLLSVLHGINLYYPG